MKRAGKLLVMMLSVLMILCFPLPVSAASGNGNSADPDATGLITSYALSCTAGSKRILINANVYASDVMAKIGFKDITIEQSSTGTGGWSTYFQPSDQMASDAMSHSLNNFLIAVPGGYYYRVTLTNYAKEYGWFFPDSQSITNYSNVVWVPAG